jgi:hypothetical protein
MESRGRETGGAHASAVAPWLPELLETLEEFGTASLGLVAWELSLPEDALLSAQRQAIAEGLIEVAGRDRDSGEEIYRIAGGRSLPI